MSTRKPLQTELYGELLDSEQQYWKEISQFSRLTYEQECVLIDRAKTGDIQARNELICSLLPAVAIFAKRYACLASCTSFLDFCSTVSMELLSTFDNVLEKKDPYVYLLGVAKKVCWRYLKLQDPMIKNKTGYQDYDKENIPCCSLDAPLGEDGSQFTDILEDIPLQSYQETSQEKYRPLYAAIQTLPEKQQAVILQYNGLCDKPQLTFVELEYELTGRVVESHWGGKGKNLSVYSSYRRAIVRLKKILEPVYATA